MEQPANTSTRRTALKCMAWTGTGLVWTLSGGVPRAAPMEESRKAGGAFSFIQISDSHIGFRKPPNPDPSGTLREAVARIAAVKTEAALLIHTGDVSHLSRAQQFDDASAIIGEAGLETHFVPGEHDMLDEDGKGFFERFPAGARTGGWYSFDQHGVHFVALNNVVNLKAGGLGNLGADQLAWLADDLRGRSSSQPLVVFAHIPLWTVYREWGWGTEDAGQALALFARFGSVTVLNGHIHQVMQKVEGTVAFHTCRSTAFPQPAPGTAPSPGPIRDVPPGRLRSLLGITRVAEIGGRAPLAIVDTPLGA